MSKGESDMWLGKGKGSHLCFASGQISQSLLKVQIESWSTFFNKESLAYEGWPNLRYHREEGTIVLLSTWDWGLLKTDPLAKHCHGLQLWL